MKKIIFLLLPFTLVLSTCEKKDDGPTLNNDPVNITDTTFLSVLIEEGVDTDGDGIISVAEAEAVESLDISGPLAFPRDGIRSLNGIALLKNLRFLDCSWNNIKKMDISKNTALEELRCGNNEIDRLNVSNKNALKKLFCERNQLESLDLSNNSALTCLSCGA
ncbi:hypothetical protein ACFLTU_11010, partial [Bacteroidota bacterium]